MGCFNSSGFISGLPIKYGDRVVCFIGITKKNMSLRELYYPDSMVAPFFLPVRGEYDDYGCVQNIDRTHIVEMIEKYADADIETVLNGIERCIYGGDVQENLKYWMDAKEDAEKHGYMTEMYESEVNQYKPLLRLFSNTRDVVSFTNLAEYLEKAGEDPERFLKYAEKCKVSPVLMFEHEDIYDKITQDFVPCGEEDSSFFLPFDKRYHKFLDHIKKLKDFYDGLEDEEDRKDFNGMIPNLSGYVNTTMSYMKLFLKDVSPEEYGEKLKEFQPDRELYFLSSNSGSLEMFDRFSTEDKFDVFEKDEEELRRFYNLYSTFSLMPMFFSVSQTAGMQEYRYDLIEKVYNVCYEKLRTDKDEYDKESREYQEWLENEHKSDSLD